MAEQLAAFGLSPAQIAKKARIKRADVDTALAVAGSELAKKATARYADLTLDKPQPWPTSRTTPRPPKR